MSRHRRYETLGILMTFHAFPDEVMGKFCLVEAVVPPGLGAPPNTHAGETETFVVLDGEVDFMVDGVERRVGPGQSLSIPDGALHAFAAKGSKPARVMILNAPGRMHEQFFTELGTPVTDDRTAPAPQEGPPDVARIMAVAEACGMTIVAPAEA
ncbi:cupin domain-containing protein [Roseibacterium sp. SDUM158016]|uniref:cupin domain-containing protein n=1 Tax=Roseicyclus sediminis TaxID=2980997 RepID=UPI0021D39C7F|nr:cupin domain-containing protein [Roseibacterium sp. SDUM158016]MCU4654460.1 cupin domain-containing protein [Roseibacterium sp. SDUM158016]